ncbi:hypothetical protein ma805 [Moumouvirus australiensis]|uniref:Uncharacterized protein n=1 Tax=Moumouvirus australiensis TaxID=2109587 RepID=A0A2P1EMU4_9VIRU|nr:hypothetical protein QKC55_gp099 [Moumouvirus australiensis]AVL95192.1 hypothetical protein ma805 [Moumouvirus australiensis]
MSYNQQNLEEFYDAVEVFGNRYFDVQEKCSIWRQITNSGRKECTEAKQKLLSDLIKASKKSNIVKFN